MNSNLPLIIVLLAAAGGGYWIVHHPPAPVPEKVETTETAIPVTTAAIVPTPRPTTEQGAGTLNPEPDHKKSLDTSDAVSESNDSPYDRVHHLSTSDASDRSNDR